MLSFLCKSIFIIVVSIIYFYIKEYLTSYDIASYSFIIGAYIIFICTPYFTKHIKNKTVQDMPVYTTSFIYLLVEIIIAVSINYIDIIEIKKYVAIQSILTGLYLIILLGILCINKQTNTSIQAQNTDILYLKELILSLKISINKLENANIKKKIENISDLLKASPTKSNYIVQEIENNIYNKIKGLETLIYDSNNEEQILNECNTIEHLIIERNNRLNIHQYK